MRSGSSSSGSVGLPTLLFVLFLTLKLTGVIDWSWWWVTAPLWAPLALVVLFPLGAALVGLLGVGGAWLMHRWWRR